MEDVSDRHRVEEALERRDRVLSAVGFAAERFLSASSWEESIQEVLARLGEAAGVSRAYIFEIAGARDGQPLFNQRFEWAAPEISAEIANPEMQNMSLGDAGVDPWADELRAGRLVHAHVRNLPEKAGRSL